MPRKDTTSGPISAQAQQELVSEGIENFELPKSLVTRIAKTAVPENTRFQKEAVLSMVKGSTVFVNYLAATAHDVAVSKQHKSISPSDVLKALEMIEFGDLVEPLQHELALYRANNKPKKAPSSKSKPGTDDAGPSYDELRATIAARAKDKDKPKQSTGGASLPPPFTNAPLGGGSAMTQMMGLGGPGVNPAGVLTRGDDVAIGDDIPPGEGWRWNEQGVPSSGPGSDAEGEMDVEDDGFDDVDDDVDVEEEEDEKGEDDAMVVEEDTGSFAGMEQREPVLDDEQTRS